MILQQERDPQGFIRKWTPQQKPRHSLGAIAQLAFAVLCMTAVLLVATHRKAEAFRLGGIIEVVQDGTGEHGKPCYRYTICTMDIHGLRICYTDYVCPNG